MTNIWFGSSFYQEFCYQVTHQIEGRRVMWPHNTAATPASLPTFYNSSQTHWLAGWLLFTIEISFWCWFISPQMIHKPGRERSNIYTFHWRTIDWDANQKWDPILYIPLQWLWSNSYIGGLERERLKTEIIQPDIIILCQLLLSSFYLSTTKLVLFRLEKCAINSDWSLNVRQNFV